MTMITVESLAKLLYETEERLRAEDDTGPSRAVWVPWEAQTAQRERRIYRALAEIVLRTLPEDSGPTVLARAMAMAHRRAFCSCHHAPCLHQEVTAPILRGLDEMAKEMDAARRP